MKLGPASTKIEGPIVRDWKEFGHHFQIEKLLVPRRVGAGDRHYRLWLNGHPADGGQWCYDLEGALNRADYVLQSSYAGRIAWLEAHVNNLTRDLYRARNARVYRVKAGRRVL